jgi:hypothetical protein
MPNIPGISEKSNIKCPRYRVYRRNQTGNAQDTGYIGEIKQEKVQSLIFKA